MLVHIVNEFIFDCTFSPGLYSTNFIESLVKAGKAVLEAGESAARRAGVNAKTVLLESIGGVAADLILAQARKVHADLIVMGTHGRRGIFRLALGSDAEQVVHATHVPVVLVRAQAATENADLLEPPMQGLRSLMPSLGTETCRAVNKHGRSSALFDKNEGKAGAFARHRRRIPP